MQNKPLDQNSVKSQSMRLAISCTILIATMLTTASQCFSDDFTFPECPNVIDITKPPYNAHGDGLSDDTEALQKAINENTGRHRLLYFPPGTYLISSTLSWPKRYGDRDNWGFTYLSGAGPQKSIIRLKDKTITNPLEPNPMMWCGGFGSADWFHNYIENLTFDVGDGNPGAIGVQFYSNNSGAIRNCIFRGKHDSGHTGLDLVHRDMNGPLLVYNCVVEGFRTGIHTGNSVNGQVFENITLNHQAGIGFVNEGQSICIRNLSSDNAVTTLSSYGMLCLVDGILKGSGNAANVPAIVNFNGGRIFLRNITTIGYGRALGDVHHTPDGAAANRIRGVDKEGSEGPHIAEYVSHPVSKLFDSPSGSLALEVKETPPSPRDPSDRWANVDDFGADATGELDSSESIQKAIDSGATTVFLPGSYNLRKTVSIRGNVQRLVGLGGQINYGKGLDRDFQVVDGASPHLFIEHFAHIGGGIRVDVARTLIVRSVSDCDFTSTEKVGSAEWFFEDVVTHKLQLTSQKFWARQLNIENEGTHLRNLGSDVWILGYKTERGGTLADTQAGGRTEILGGFSYTTTAGNLAPMLINEDSKVWAFFGEVCYNGDPFATLVKETRGNQTKEIIRGAGGTWPYAGYIQIGSSNSR